MALLDERRKRLASEGSSTWSGAALPFLQMSSGWSLRRPSVIRDILHRLNDRFSRRVLVWQCACREKLRRGSRRRHRGFNHCRRTEQSKPDVLIVARAAAR